MDNPQYYQPLSHALHAPFVSASHSSPRQQYAPYTPHQQPPVTNGAGSGHHEEEEEEEEDDEEVVEEELDHHDTDPPHHSASSHSSPRVNAVQSQSSSTGATSASASADYRQAVPQRDHTQVANDDGAEKRKPGRPRGSRNRKPRVSTGSATKAPANTQHPGFYQYPPAPGANMSQQNQQFYEFQWRALNLCSEFYNAAEELVKAASPMVIAQCYQMGPATKIDPLMMIAEAKRVCDNLLANPSQLVGQPIPTTTYPTYPSMPPPPPPGATASAGPAPPAGAMITNPQTFVMPLNSSAMPPPSQPYYPPMYPPAPGSRYPTTPYYYPPPQGATSYYPPPHAAQPLPPAPPPPAAQPVQPPTAPPAPAPTPAPAPAPTPQPVPQASPSVVTSSPVPSNTGTISTFNAATGNAAPGGHQGTWSEEETDRLRRLAEQSRDMGGPQNKGEIEWDWVVQQWGNSRTRHQILLKATGLGLKESTTRGTKRRRADDTTPTEQAIAPPPQTQTQAQAHQHSQPHPQPQPQQPPQGVATSAVSPTRSPMNSTPTSINASPAIPPQRPPSSTTSTHGTPRTTTNAPAPPTTASSMPWPLPTMASSSSILPSATAALDPRNNSYYRPRPTQTTSYGAAAAAAATNQRPPSSHGTTTSHQYMYRPNGTGVRRDSGA